MFRSSSAAAAAESAAAEAAQKATKAQIAACAAYKDRSVLWPDPDIGVPAPLKQSQPAGSAASADSEVERIAHAPSPLLADNVSGLQETRVSGFFYPMNAADVADVLARARALGKKIAMRGTAHCMGRHNTSEDALLIDFSYMKAVKVDAKNSRVTCQPGARWSDLIVALNPYGLSPRTMQSYSSFAVGGTLACNAHGITTDFTAGESVVSVDIMTYDGVVHTCTPQHAAGTLEHDLFRHVLGGFGLFGIMVSITMRTTPNDSLLADSFVVPTEEFPALYDRFLAESQPATDATTPAGSAADTGSMPPGAISVKLVRLNILNLERCQIYLFRKRGHAGTVSQMTDDNSSSPRQMSLWTRVLYKWLLPSVKELRYNIEEESGSALDWSEASAKNQLMFESAEPLAKLIDPMFAVSETFILQEFFVAREHFMDWIRAAKPIYTDIAKNEMPGPETRVQLLNTTIRFVHKDTVSSLPYAQAENGSYAFVLYYRLLRTQASVDYLASINRRFMEVTCRFNKSVFYLPYLHQYDQALLLRAYPMLPDFVKAKERLDPQGIFDSGWWREYALPLASAEYRKKFVAAAPTPAGKNVHQYATTQAKTGTVPDAQLCPIVSEHRTDSLRALMNDNHMRTAFCSEFLVNVFNLMVPSQVEQALSRACWDPRNKTDQDIYVAFQKQVLTQAAAGPIAQAKKGWAQLSQLSAQKRELTEETVRLLTRLGKLGKIRDYLSMGDHGKLVVPLRRELCIDGAVHIVHDEPQPEDSVLVAVETGTNGKLGDFHLIDWSTAQGKLAMCASGSFDLVTLMQGIHHMPQTSVPTLLREIERVLRPGGIFITREHELDTAGIPMCDAAHAVFNAITGVPPEMEAKEIRAFRPAAEWRRIITSVTSLQDAMVFEVQPGDPTVDIMMAFYKAPLHPYCDPASPAAKAEVERLAAIAQGKRSLMGRAAGGPMPMPPLPMQQTLERLPDLMMSFMRGLLGSIAPVVEGLGDKIAGAVAPPEYAPVVKAMIRQYTEPLAAMAHSILRQTQYTAPRRLQLQMFPTELIVAFMALQAQVAKGKATPQVAFLVTTVNNIMGALLGTDNAAKEAAERQEKERQSALLLSMAHQQQAGGGAEGGGMGMQIASSNIFDGDANEPIEMHHREIVAEAKTLLLAFPQLVDPDTLLDLGFSEPVVDLLANFLPPTLVKRRGTEVVVDEAVLDGAMAVLEQRIDSEVWAEARRHIRAIVQHKPQLTFDVLLGRDVAGGDVARAVATQQSRSGLSPWFRLFMALLGSPRVQVTYAVQLTARFYGIPELGQLYAVAQDMRAARRARRMQAAHDIGIATPTSPLSMSNHLPAEAVQEMDQALALLETPLRTITMTGEKQIKNIFGVAEIISATYSGKEVTQIMREQLMRPVTAAYQREAVASAGPAAAQMKMVLLEGGIGRLDSVFGKGLTALSQFFYSDRQICITYKSGGKVPAENLKHASTLVKRVLTASRSPEVRAIGLGSAATSAQQMTLHIFKLLEWLQVEVLKDMTISLDHTPWYRYPLLDSVLQYWRVFGDIASESISKVGIKGTVVDGLNGFSTAFVPGVVMALMFGQLKLLAMPVQATFGTSYDDSGLVSKVLVHIPTGGRTTTAAPAASAGSDHGVNWPASITAHPKVSMKTLYNSGALLVHLTLPVFKDYSTLLCDLARHSFDGGRATLLDIDGNAGEVMVKFRTGLNTTGHAPRIEEVLRARGFSAARLLSQYNSTCDGTANAKPGVTYHFEAIMVPVPQLMEVVRCADAEGITIVQIFDFY